MTLTPTLTLLLPLPLPLPLPHPLGRYVAFFQDTNVLAFKALPAALGALG